MINVAIIDHPGSGAQGANLTAIAAALQRQAREHFCRAWFVGDVSVSVAIVPKTTDWVIGLFADADQPGALGYHDTTPNGTPLAKVFPKLDAQDGANLSTTISHELLEMLADPFLTRAVQDRTGKFWALEVCDAVEQDEYQIDGVTVSNFVLPQYFEPPAQLAGIRLDERGLVKTPFEVRPGGYMQWFGTDGWQQVLHSEVLPRPYRSAATRGRFARRRGAP